MVDVKIKMLGGQDCMPVYGSDQAAGADLKAAIPEAVEIAPHETFKVPTGIAVSIPDGYFGGVYARSGLSTREGLRPANAVGVIDSDYTGEVIVALHNDSEEVRTVEPGERVAQLVIQPYERARFSVVDDLEETERGAGGFGSTGSK